MLYTGNGSTQSITGVNFQPDFAWIKERSSTSSHILSDAVRGSTKNVFADKNDAEETSSTRITSFDSDGFSLGSSGAVNQSSQTYVGWNWLAGTAFSNDASATGIGTVDSSGQVNTTAGFSIVTFTGGSAGYTVAHGLSAAPEIIFTFNRTDSSGANYVFTTAIDGTIDYFSLNATTAKNDDPFSMPAFTNTVFSLDNDYGMDAGDNCVAYCFHSVEGYSKVGSFVGNNSADGAFAYTGFRPAFVMVKNSSSSSDWQIADSTRNTYNVTNAFLEPNTSDAENTGRNKIDLLSNGFKCRESYGDINGGSGNVFIYLAFAETPFKFANAR